MSGRELGVIVSAAFALIVGCEECAVLGLMIAVVQRRTRQRRRSTTHPPDH